MFKLQNYVIRNQWSWQLWHCTKKSTSRLQMSASHGDGLTVSQKPLAHHFYAVDLILLIVNYCGKKSIKISTVSFHLRHSRWSNPDTTYKEQFYFELGVFGEFRDSCLETTIIFSSCKTNDKHLLHFVSSTIECYSVPAKVSAQINATRKFNSSDRKFVIPQNIWF